HPCERGIVERVTCADGTFAGGVGGGAWRGGRLDAHADSRGDSLACRPWDGSPTPRAETPRARRHAAHLIHRTYASRSPSHSSSVTTHEVFIFGIGDVNAKNVDGPSRAVGKSDEEFGHAPVIHDDFQGETARPPFFPGVIAITFDAGASSAVGAARPH